MKIDTVTGQVVFEHLVSASKNKAITMPDPAAMASEPNAKGVFVSRPLESINKKARESSKSLRKLILEK